MHDLSAELDSLPDDDATRPLRRLARRQERRALFPVRKELIVALYVAVATLIAGMGLLVRAHLARIGPFGLLCGLLVLAGGAYAVALRARRLHRDRSMGEDYLLLLGALTFSAAVGYAEMQYRVFGAGWSRHLLLLAVWHLATARLFQSRLVLTVALTAFAGWLGAEPRLGTVFDPMSPLLGTGPRSLLCGGLFWLGSRLHRDSQGHGSGFREVYLQFAVNFGFWGVLALGAEGTTRWLGTALLVALAVWVGRAGWREGRQSYLLYAIGYCTIGLVQLEFVLIPDYWLRSLFGLVTVAGALLLLLSLRSRLKVSEA